MNSERSNNAQVRRIVFSNRISAEADEIIRDYAKSSGVPINTALEIIVISWWKSSLKETLNKTDVEDRVSELEQRLNDLCSYVDTITDDVFDLHRHTGIS